MEKKAKRKRKVSIKIIYTITVICGLTTLATLFYPNISDAWNRYVASKRITEYISSMSDSEKDYSEMAASAVAYNEALFAHSANNINEYTRKLSGDTSKPGNKLSGEVVHPDKEYESQINVAKDGMMCYIEIPSIDVSLPVYHYASEEILSKGIGHLYGSSLPVGGPSTHTALTGHTGLINMKIFTDLEKLKEGDLFSVHIFGEKHNYQIDQIKVVKPNETKDLSIEEGKDLVTLITCTPYGVNSHRLLVRGHRVADDIEAPEEAAVDRVIKIVNFPLTIFVLCILALLIAVGMIIKIWRS